MKITYLKQGDNGWYLRFSGPTEDWMYIKNWLKDRSKGPFKNTWFVHNYKWSPTSKPGAWWVSNAILKVLDIMDVFENLDAMIASAIEEDEEPIYSSYRHKVYEEGQKVPTNVLEAFNALKLPMTKDKEQIKKAYRTLAFAYHPDRGGDINQMKAVNVANDIIMQWIERAM